MRRLPTDLKALSGTLRRDRVNHREPRPPRSNPRPRRSLAKIAKVEHRRLVSALAHLHVTTAADGLALELAAQALAEYRTAVDVLLREGQSYTCTTEAGATMHRARPEQAIAADAWRRAMHAIEQFGLTPVSRAKVEAVPPFPLPLGAMEAVGRRRSGANDPHDELHRRRALRERTR